MGVSLLAEEVAVRAGINGAYRTAFTPIGADAALLVARVACPTSDNGVSWDGEATVRITVNIDGVDWWVEGRVTGGVQLRKDGKERTEYVLSFALPLGYFTDRAKVPRAEWASIAPKRLGETAKSRFEARAEITCLKGRVDAPLSLDVVYTPAPSAADLGWSYHESITYQNATSATESGGDGALSMSFTAGAGSNRAALVVAGAGRSSAVTGFTVTYGGAAPATSQLWSATEGTYARATGDLFLDSEIGSGAKTIACTSSGGSGTFDGTVLGVVSLTGVDQTTPVGTPGTNTGTNGGAGTPSVTVGSVGATDMVVDGIYEYADLGTVGANQTSRVDNDGGDIVIRMSTQSGADGGAMTHTRGGSVGEFAMGAVAFKEASAGSVSVTPTTASLTLTTYAPTVTASDHKSVTPSTATLTLTTFAPTVTASDNKSVTPSTATLTLTTFAPTVTATQNQLVTPSTATLTLTTYAPTVTASGGQVATPSTATLTLTTYAPTVSVSDNKSVTPSTATLTLTTYAPTVTATDHKTATPTTATLTITTYAPTVTATDHKSVTPATATLTLTTFAPTVTTAPFVAVTPSITRSVTLEVEQASSINIGVVKSVTITLDTEGTSSVTLGT